MIRRRVSLSDALAPAPRARVTGAVLAGGRGSRLGGCEKALLELAGRPLIARVLEDLRPQVASVGISANSNRARYAAMGCQVVADVLPGRAGPMAGLLSVLRVARTPYVLVVPGDAPAVPRDLARRLYAALLEDGADVAVVHDGRHLQPLYMLVKRRVAADLAEYLDTGGRSALGWLERQRHVLVDFSDRADELFNVNTPQDLAAALRRLDRTATG